MTHIDSIFDGLTEWIERGRFGQSEDQVDEERRAWDYVIPAEVPFE